MELVEFKILAKKYFEKNNIEITDEKTNKLYSFMQLLIEENKKINLTAITDPKEIIIKHFTDSLVLSKYLKDNCRIIDVGTGGGFPGIPLAIYNEKTEILLLDTLKKRIEFLDKVIEENNLKNAQTCWGRAEDTAHKDEYREVFDVAVSRAVAPMNVLIEYLLPFVKVNGICICMKGPNYKEELEECNKALYEMGGKIEQIEEIDIEGLKRFIIIVKKEKNTNVKYPRKAGIPSKKPIK